MTAPRSLLFGAGPLTVSLTVGLALVLACALPTVAQAQSVSRPRPPGWRVAVMGGATSVRHAGGQAGIELSRRWTDKLELTAEGVWFQETVTRRQQTTALGIATFLAESQHQQTVFQVKVPAAYVGVGARYFLNGPRAKVRLYVLAAVGAARTTLRPRFSLGGTDVTGQLDSYGVRLGADLTGAATTPAVTGGLGGQLGRGRWQLDGTIRFTSIQMNDAPATPVLRAGLAIHRGF